MTVNSPADNQGRLLTDAELKAEKKAAKKASKQAAKDQASRQRQMGARRRK
jgi:hypothetical protein